MSITFDGLDETDAGEGEDEGSLHHLEDVVGLVCVVGVEVVVDVVGVARCQAGSAVADAEKIKITQKDPSFVPVSKFPT